MGKVSGMWFISQRTFEVGERLTLSQILAIGKEHLSQDDKNKVYRVTKCSDNIIEGAKKRKGYKVEIKQIRGKRD
jgi:hypothetical protein